ncbi:MAG: hypothetical protein CAPSK01_002134 [Candidatus Accumulibacter vicinus]|uniref:Uncharacterized protein n=1 Tax=Candidatus Accumulibacter vicinus TaxID=2954382 RepID=A0A084Y0N7_9PROT|nr:MAG: hypothetical protein CAPSK01_002134 [Candidatus Accumulibacter vicinus]
MKPDDMGGQGNVLGGPPGASSEKPINGFFRDGCCNRRYVVSCGNGRWPCRFEGAEMSRVDEVRA